MTKGPTPRQLARAENIERIKALALDQLATSSAGELSLRAIARELNLVSSALYRYFPSRDDLLTALIQAEAEGEKLTQGELFAMIILLFIAGHETTTNLIGNGTLALLRHQDQLQLLRDDPSLVVAATEELLRYDSPVQITARTATIDLEVNGLPLAKGESVVCGLAAGNRDPRYVDDPETLRLDRGRPTHLSFSNGMHYCLGAPLARLEGQIAFSAMASRFAGMELTVDEPAYRDHFVLRGLASLPVAVR
jgi:cytochrome P450